MDALYIFLVALSAFVCAAIFTMIIVFALRYRRRKGVEAEQIEGSTVLEITWSAVPLFIFLFIFRFLHTFCLFSLHLTLFQFF